MTSYHDLDRQIEQLKRCELIKEGEVKELCEKAIEILSAESNVKRISAPVQVCGDIHGQFYDLRELFLVGGQVPDVSYLFLGDYIDRGFYGVESFLLLLALKVRYPDRVTLLRGNHECRQVTHVYGFYDECVKKYGSTEVWKMFMDVCDCLALAAVIDDKIFCVHGGLSPLINTIGEIQGIDRRQEVPAGSSMSDLLWSDPEEITGWQASTRGTGYLFGRDVVEKFNMANGIDLICRAHQLVAEGYKWHFDGRLITVWSAPNYCYRCGNQGCILEIDDNHGVEVNVFEAAPQEDRPPFINQRIPDYFV